MAVKTRGKKLQRVATPGPLTSRKHDKPPISERPWLLRPATKQTVFADTAITAGVAMGATLWTASRNKNTGADILWSAFWMGLGGVMAVEGTGELQYGGFALVGSMSAYLGLRLTGGINPGAF